MPAILNALAGLQDSIERVEMRLSALNNPSATRESAAEECERLERELSELLRVIARLKQTGLASTTIRRPVSAVEERASLELARLRRDQARLVFRLEELRSGAPCDERFLT